MSDEYANQAIQSVLNSQQAYCKFLSANDSGETGGHQRGILVSKAASRIMFHQSLKDESILKRTVEINWQNNLQTESCFTYYRSKNELRITKFGRKFPFLRPDQTGALFVFTRQAESQYSGFFLETDDDIGQFLNAFGLSPTETNRLIEERQVQTPELEKIAIQKFITSLTVDFPSSEEMSAAARDIQNSVHNHLEYIRTNPDQKIIDWTTMEYILFRAIEHFRYGEKITRGFASVDDFISMANMVLNRRKSRAGRSLEHHLSAIFDENRIKYTSQAVTEGSKRPDFIFPSQSEYHDMEFPTEKLISLAAKTTCKDRWRQIINEANRLRDRPKYLCTLQQGISPTQLEEMQAENVILVVPKPYIMTYPKNYRDKIWTLSKFIQYVREVEEL